MKENDFNSIENQIEVIRNSEFFDENYYLEKNSDVSEAKMNAIDHYCRFGWREKRNPSKAFNTKFYLEKNLDVYHADMNPLYHYILFGINEGRMPIDVNRICLYKRNKTIVFIGHEAEKTGAPMLLLDIIKWFNKCTAYKVKVILLRGGPIQADYDACADTLTLNPNYNKVSTKKLVEEFMGQEDCFIFLNTVVAARFVQIIDLTKYPCVAYIHELEKTMRIFPKETKLMKRYVRSIIADSDRVADNLLENHGYSQNEVQTVCGFINPMISNNDESIRSERRKELGIPEDTVLIFGCGSVYWRKNPKAFVEIAELVKGCTRENCMFIWIGDGEEKFECEQMITGKELKDYVKFIGAVDSTRHYFIAGDIFLLPSIEDPFPLVCLESAECGLPIICYDKVGGIPKFVEEDAGFVVPLNDIEAMAKATIELVDNKQLRETMGKNARKKVLIRHSVDNSAQIIKKIVDEKFSTMPLVSVIVPNYNHEMYLRQRLDSIYNQTFKDFEIILLDDASTDNSRDILDEYANNNPYITSKIYNHENSKSVFHQWIKGIEAAKGDFIWIAESDDYCENIFLEKILPKFSNESVSLSYSQSKVVDEEGTVWADSYLGYTDELSKDKWLKDYTISFRRELNEGLAVKNTIPNVSAVVFRKFELTEDEKKDLLSFKVAGDWWFYLKAGWEGSIAYVRASLNYHRRHHLSVIAMEKESLAILEETQRIHAYVLSNLAVTKNIVTRMSTHIDSVIQCLGNPKCSQIDYESLNYQVDMGKRLNILIFISEINYGGGEIFPIRLANILSGRTHNVTLLSADYRPQNDNILAMINPEIEVYSAKEWVDPKASLQMLLVDKKIDIINSFVWWADQFLALNLVNSNIPWCVYMCGCYENLMDYFYQETFKKVMQILLTRVNTFIYSADKNLSVFKKYQLEDAKEHLVKIPIGFERKRKINSKLRSELNIAEDAFVFCMIARGIPEKGWEEAIEMSMRLKDKGYDVYLLLGGESEYVEQLKEKCKYLEFIIFLGFVPDTSRVISISDVCLLPTYYISESMPMIVVEYVAYGKPVITTDIGEIPWMIEIEEGSCGALLSLKDKSRPNVDEFVRIAEEYITNEALYKAHADRTKLAFEAFSMDACANRFLQVYYNNLL